MSYVAVGLLAKKAVEAGLTIKNSFIKTSLSPGSGVVTYYLKESHVMEYLEKLGLAKVFSRVSSLLEQRFYLCTCFIVRKMIGFEELQ